MGSANAHDIRLHLQRVLESGAFRKAPALCHLLEYLVTKSLEGHSEHIKESVLAVEVFGRRLDFDGRVDNIVRVQAHRLRKLLDAYYAEEGKSDQIRFSIPRGTYVPQIGAMAEIESTPQQVADDTNSLPPTTALRETKPSARLTALVAVAFIAGAFAAIVTVLLIQRHAPARTAEPSGALADIWNGVFEPGARVIVSFTNPIFLRVGRSATYLRYRGPLSAPPGTEVDVRGKEGDIDGQFVPRGTKLFFNDGWTGTGEVLAVNRLTELSTQFRQHLNVVPSRALALNEMHGANVIFLGSPGVNGALAQMGSSETPLYNTEDGRIAVRDSRQGEPSDYRNVIDRNTSQIESCYVLFSVLPGIDDGRRVVSSSGIGTWATWAGIDFATSESGAAQLSQMLKRNNGGVIPRYYQAVIRADLIKAMASNPQLITVRLIRSGNVER